MVQVRDPVTPAEAPPEGRSIADKLHALGWGLFFIWLGILFVAGLGAEIGLLGIGALVLAMQATRKAFNLELEGFWLAMGGLFLAGGVWGLVNPAVPFVSFVLIVAGVAILASLVRRR
jgi:hypothetical protein